MNPRPFGSRRIARDSSPVRRRRRSSCSRPKSPPQFPRKIAESRITFTSRPWKLVRAVYSATIAAVSSLAITSTTTTRADSCTRLRIGLRVATSPDGSRSSSRLTPPRRASLRVSSSRGVRNPLSRCRRCRCRVVVVVAPCRSSWYTFRHRQAAGHNVSSTLAPRCDDGARIRSADKG